MLRCGTRLAPESANKTARGADRSLRVLSRTLAEPCADRWESASKAHVLLSTAACPAGPARLRHGGAGAFCGALHDPRLDVKRMEATSLARTAETAFASLCR